MSGVTIPVAFLLERQHVAFAERVVLSALCRALTRHWTCVSRATFAAWRAETVGRRVLASYAQNEQLVRQTTLAHACAIVQQKLHTRMRVLVRHWLAQTRNLRVVEQNQAAVVLQRCWRRHWLLSCVTQLARVSRDCVRYANATCIQCAIRCWLARLQYRLLAANHRRTVAATRLQHSYRTYQLVKVARRQRQREAAVRIQRLWRGECGRRDVQRRRALIRRVAAAVYCARYRPVAVATVMRVSIHARVLQRCVRAFLTRCRVAHSVQKSRRRRLCVPASRIQRAFRGFKARSLEAVVAAAVDALIVCVELAARRIQRAFRRCTATTRQQAAVVLTALFRCFQAKHTTMDQQLVWLAHWQATYATRWRWATVASTRWQPQLTALDERLHQLIVDQHSARARLQTRTGFRLFASMKRFHCVLVDSSANVIRRHWRSYRLQVTVRTLVRAARQLRTLLPVVFRGFKRRQQRRRVLGRWKRQRFAALKRVFDHWRTLRSLVREARMLRVSNDGLRRVRWFRHQKLRQRAFRGWKAFVTLRREHRSRVLRADAWASLQLTRQCWRVWHYEQLPRLTVQNRLRELTAVVEAWQQLWKLWQRWKQRQRVNEWRAQRLRRLTVEAWKADWRQMNDDVAAAQRHSERLVLQRSFSALRRHVAQLQHGVSLTM